MDFSVFSRPWISNHWMKLFLVFSGCFISTVHWDVFYYSHDQLKWLVFDIALSIVAFVYWPKSPSAKFSYLGMLAIALLGFMIVSLIYAPNTVMGLEFIVRFSLVFLAGYALISRLDTKGLVNLLLSVSVLSAFAFCVVFVFERHLLKLPYNVGSFSPLGFMNNSGQVFNVWIPCLVLYIFLNRKSWLKAISVTLLLLCVVSILMEAGTRGTIIGLALGELMVFSIMLFQNRKRALYFLSITVLLLSGMGLYQVSDALKNGRLSQKIVAMEKGITASTGRRIQMFDNTWQMALDNPMGVGINNFEYVHPKYGNPGGSQASPFINEKQILRTPHNIVLKLYSELGLIGGTLFLLLLGYFFLSALYNAVVGSLIDKWLLVAVTALMFHSLVSAVYLTPGSLFFAWLLLTTVTSRFSFKTGSWRKIKLNPRVEHSRWALLLIPAFSASLTLSAFYGYQGRLQFDEHLLGKALMFNPHNERALYLLSHVQYRKKRDVRASLEAIDKMLEIYPYHLSALYIKSERHFQLGENGQAKESIESLLGIYPTYSKAQRLQQAIHQRLN